MTEKETKTDGKPIESTIVWRPKIYPIGKFNYNEVKLRVEKVRASGDKEALKTITKNIKRVCADNPEIFDEFLELIQ
mgnify:CR=1 FL=1